MQNQDLGKEGGPPCSRVDPSSTGMGRAWSDKRWGVPWSVAGLLAELAFAFPTHEDDDAHSTQDPCADDPADPEAVPVIIKRTVFIFGVVGIQGRQTCQKDEQAQDGSLHDGGWQSFRAIQSGGVWAGPPSGSGSGP